VDGKSKGNRTELHLCKLFTEHFKVEFNRSVGSGNRWGQVKTLSALEKQVYAGDITPPEGFLWVIECKGGYEDQIDLNNIMPEGIRRLDLFIEQSGNDSEECGRKPMICWKRNRRPWLAMLRANDLYVIENDFPIRITYKGWTIICLEDLLEKTAKSFWFKESGTR